MKPANNAGSNTAIKEGIRAELAKDSEAFLVSGRVIYQAAVTENKLAKPPRSFWGFGFNRHEIKDIRERLAAGESPQFIAELFEVSVVRIQNIANRSSYKDIK